MDKCIRRGKIKITSEFLSQLIFGKIMQHMEIDRVKDEEVFVIYIKDPSLDVVMESISTPMYAMSDDKKLIRTPN